MVNAWRLTMIDCARIASSNTGPTGCIRIRDTTRKSDRTQSNYEKNPFGGQTTTTKQEPIHYISSRHRYNQQNNQNTQRRRGGFRGRPYQRGTQNTRVQHQRNTNPNNQKQCYNCGNQYSTNHLQSSPAKDKICSKCAEPWYFAKVCLSTNVNYLANEHDEQQEEIETESTETDNDPVAFAELTTKKDGVITR